MQVDAHKAADRSVCQQIIRPSRGMQAGLKILCAFWLRSVKRGRRQVDREHCVVIGSGLILLVVQALKVGCLAGWGSSLPAAKCHADPATRSPELSHS
jgi:hypothetical protein